MKGYVIGLEHIHDKAMFDEYVKAISHTIAAHGGKVIIRAGKMTLLEGQSHPRVVVIEFPSREAAEGWYNSPEYQKGIHLRHNSTSTNLVIVEGVPDGWQLPPAN